MIATTDRIEKQIDIKAPIAKVWNALTDPRQFGEWFGVKLDGPFTPGKVTTGTMSGNTCGHDNVKFWATIEKMDAPGFFSYSWHPYAIDPNVDYSNDPTTLVEFRLEAVDGGTRLFVTESGFDALPDARRAEALNAHTGGWEHQLKNVAAHAER